MIKIHKPIYISISSSGLKQDVFDSPKASRVVLVSDQKNIAVRKYQGGNIQISDIDIMDYQSIPNKYCTMEADKPEKESLQRLNKDLENYKSLTAEAQANVRRGVIAEVNAQRKQFSLKLEAANADLRKLNLILGATGAGKSTLFNYLNRLPLIIKEGVGKDGVKNQTIRLDVDLSQLPKDMKAAPIGHGFVSETTIPNFSKSQNSDVTYVDCAGEFDSREITQSIINSYFKYELAEKAEMVKLTIAINYNDIHTNRGTIFKQILKEVGNFIGLWEEFLEAKSISLVITGVDPSIKNAKSIIVSTIKEIARDVKDLGLFKQILENIAQREAVAVFLAPAKKAKTVINEDGEQEIQFQIPQGKPYTPNSKVCSADIISKTLDQTRFMAKKEGLFLHNLQSNAQFLVNAICEGTIDEIKKEVMDVIVIYAIDKNEADEKEKRPLTIEEFNSKKEVLKERINSLSEVKEISQIIQIFKVDKPFLKKYDSLCEDLNEFLKISNIPNIQKKIMEVAKDITIYLREKIEMIDKDALNLANKRYESMQKEIADLKDQEKRLEKQRAHELQMMDKQAEIQMEKQRLALEQQRIQADRKHEMEMEKIRMEQKSKRIQSKAETERIIAQSKLEEKKVEAQIACNKDEIQMKKAEIQGKLRIEEKKVDKEENVGAIVVKTLVDVAGKVVDKTIELATPLVETIISKRI